MKSIKDKLGLSKDKEITAHFWCSLVGSDFDEVRKQIISSCLLLVFLLYIPFEQTQLIENRVSNGRARRTLVIKRDDITA